MKIRVLEGCRGFYGGVMRYGVDDNHRKSDVFEIKDRVCVNRVDSKGNPVVLSEDEQFSSKWMERVDKPRAKPGPKPKAELAEEE